MSLEQEVGNSPAGNPELPLVLEIVPGQASKGLIDIYDAGSFENKIWLDVKL